MAQSLVFVKSNQPEIDRGWRPDDAADVASGLGFNVSILEIQTRAALDHLLNSQSDILVWPVCYTIGPDVDGTLLTVVLEAFGSLFVGAGPGALLLSSKLAFKEALAAQTSYRSPDYHLVQAGDTPSAGIGFPAVIKTEFSCNSEGVAVADDPLAFADLYAHLSAKYQQTIYVERWERAREYTVAYMPPLLSAPATAAALEIQITGTAKYLDTRTKDDNSLLRLSSPEIEKATTLEDITIDIARLLKIDGHFRLDFVENEHGELFPIEVNFLPFLTNTGPNRSYFPLAFELASRLTYKEIIARILTHAQQRSLLCKKYHKGE